MSKTNESLSEIFDIEPQKETINLPLEVKGEEIITLTENPIEDDFNKVRKNISHLIEKGNTAIDNLLTVARESEHPRAYEVAANMLKTLSDLNKDLLDIRKKKKDLEPGESSNNTKGPLIDKAIFVGSTEQLIDLLKRNK